MTKLKRYEVLWDILDETDRLHAFRLIGSDELLVSPIEIEDYEHRVRSARFSGRSPPPPLKDMKRPTGSIRAWFVENGATPWYNGPGDLWSCLLDEDQAMAFRLRWL